MVWITDRRWLIAGVRHGLMSCLKNETCVWLISMLLHSYWSPIGFVPNTLTSSVGQMGNLTVSLMYIAVL